MIYRFGAALFYANAGLFSDEIRPLVGPAPRQLRWLVVDAGAITHLDYTAARVVRELQQDLAQRGIPLVFAHVQDSEAGSRPASSHGGHRRGSNFR